MKCVVTGGAGFIGSHLCDALIGRGDEVVCLDNFFTGSRANVAHLLDNRRFEIVRHDVCEPWHIECDELYHLACPASPVHYQHNPARTIDTAVIGTRNALAAARDAGGHPRLLVASTSEVYGDPAEHPQKETYWGHVNSVGPRACYSDDTEVLTRRGWKLFSALSAEDAVASIDERGCVEYVLPTERIKQRVDGEMLHFQNAKMDLLVTPNHQMIDERFGRRFVRADAGGEWGHRCTPVVGVRPEQPMVKAHYPDPVAVEYHGDVFCVTAPPHHTLLVRRNGKAVFCGNCYDEGKRAGEALCIAWAAQYRVDVRIARIFNTYGPRMARGDGRLIPNFITQAIAGRHLTVYGDGSQTRSFCYVTDTVDALIRLIGTNVRAAFDEPDGTRGVPIVNVGNPDERSVLSVAQDVVRAFGRDPKTIDAPYESALSMLRGSISVRRESLPKDDPKQRCPDITRARTVLGWEPKTSYSDGIAKTIEWFRSTTPPTA